MVELQRPSHVFMGGELVPWSAAGVHVSSEALIRAASVFEGIKGYWQTDRDVFCLLAERRHYERLRRSARLLHLPLDMSYEDFHKAGTMLVERILVPGRDLWMRPTLMAVEGHWGRDTVADLVITAYTLEQTRPAPIDIGISTWQRPSDRAQPARIKSSANYQVGRLARIEGRRHGYDDMLLFNAAGRVAETTGSCVLIVRDGEVITPPASEGCLESITVDIIERMCGVLEIPFTRRPVEHSEILVADEVFLAGTLSELVPVRAIEDQPVGEDDPITRRLADLFWRVVRGEHRITGVELTEL